jgi:DNA-binding NarL/FixJ family response regulator
MPMTETDQPRVLIVDDNAAILKRAVSLLSRACAIVGAVSDPRAALEAVNTLRPDVVVLDISMPELNGFEVVGQLRRSGSTVPIVFLTVDDDEDLLRAAQAAGGIGYVVKSRIPSDLLTAVTEARAGRAYVSRMG